MTERLRAHPYAAYHPGDPRRASVSEDEGLSTKKTMLVLVVVVGCFAVLWPKLFYPMLVTNANIQMKPGPVDKTTGCCDRISEFDLDTIKIMSELCSTIIDTTGTTPPSPKEIVIQCRKAVLETCGIDISAALQDRIVSLGHSVKQILEEVRSLNGSLCLKYNFGLSPWRLGVPHRVNINLDPFNSIRQERSSHMRSEMVHPAFKERGRAIPQPEPSGLPRRTNPPPKIVEGRPGPIPGMRPAMGGPGHMVAPSKQSNYGFMGVLMPVYTIGFVIFFTYTIMKLVFKRKAETHVGAPLYPPCESDERFHKEVFEANKGYFHRPSRDTSKIVVNAVSALLEEVNQELEARKVKTPETVHEQDETQANGYLPKEDEQGTVKIMGMETTASSESGKKWSRPDSPVLPHPRLVSPKEPSPPPQQIFLEGSLPPQSQILVAESATETQKYSEDDSPVVLAGKMTLSVISLDSETGTEDSSNSVRKAEGSDEERRTSSSNVSEEFEKINAADLEDQINSILEEAENMALAEEIRYSPNDEVDKFTEEIHQTPQINEKDNDNDVLEEIKNQLNLEDDLLLALKEKDPEGKENLPVTDIIKEFLNNEEKALLAESKEIHIDDIRKENTDILESIKRSLGEELNGLEINLNKDLEAGNKISGIINQDEEKREVPDKNDLKNLKQQVESVKAEEPAILDLVSDTFVGEADNDTTTLDVDTSDAHNKEFSQKTKEDILDKEVNVSNGDSYSLRMQQILVPENEPSRKLFQTTRDAVPSANEDLKHFNEESNSEEKNENIVSEDMHKENTCSIQKVVKLEVSDIDRQGARSDGDQKNENNANRSRETTPEESNGSNKADLLLQGLMVREDTKSSNQNTAALEDVNAQTINKKGKTDLDKEKEEPIELQIDVLSHFEGEKKHTVHSGECSSIEQLISEGSEERDNKNTKETNLVPENLNRESDSGLTDEDGLIDDEDYDDSEDEELVDDEVRYINRNVYEDRRESMERRINGNEVGSSSRPFDSDAAVENEISEEEDLENEDDDEEIEEIIEYVDNTDEEGEEIVEINGNEHVQLNENVEN